MSGAAQHGAQFSAPQLVLGQIRIRIRQYCHARCVNVTDDLVPLCRRGRIAWLPDGDHDFRAPRALRRADRDSLTDAADAMAAFGIGRRQSG